MFRWFFNSYEHIEKVFNQDTNTYTITTKINTLFGSETATYNINESGAIAFDFSENSNYLNILLIGGSRTLASAMYDMAKEINPESLSGRTISGIDLELQLHYYAFNIFSATGYTNLAISAQEANIGGIDMNKSDWDRNALVFQSAQAVKILAKLSFNSTRTCGIIDATREIMDYLKWNIL